MKKFSSVLIILSFLFAATALVIAILGYLRSRNPIPTESVEEMAEEVPAIEAPAEVPAPEPEPTIVTPEELGFIIEQPASFGTFTITRSGEAARDAYVGIFSEEPGVQFTVTDPELVEGRGGYYADIAGYIKGPDSYEAVFVGGNRDTIPTDIVIGELELKKGTALLLKGKSYDTPTFYPPTVGQRLAVIGTPAGKISVALFLAEPTVSTERFRSLLESISVVDPLNP
jgi:hypothetical protein